MPDSIPPPEPITVTPTDDIPPAKKRLRASHTRAQSKTLGGVQVFANNLQAVLVRYVPGAVVRVATRTETVVVELPEGVSPVSLRAAATALDHDTPSMYNEAQKRRYRAQAAILRAHAG